MDLFVLKDLPVCFQNLVLTWYERTYRVRKRTNSFSGIRLQNLLPVDVLCSLNV